MSDKPPQGPDDLDKGVIFLSKEDWYKLQTFCLQSMHANPTTDDKMAVALGLKAEDKNKHWDPDFSQTAKDYKELAVCCEAFWNQTKPGMVDLVNDIVQYQVKMDAFFKRLIETIDDYDVGKDIQEKLDKLWAEWKSHAPSDKAARVRDRFITAASRLQEDAAGRRDKADKLKTDMDGFHDNLVKSRARFAGHQKNFENKYGTSSQEMINLKTRLETLNKELETYRKKEHDEIIVLSTSPVYLIIWPVGPLIMAGVQIGVGVDLALVRVKIDKLVGDVADETSKSTSKQKFIASYLFIKDATQKTEERIKNILPAVAKLKDGWKSIADDLRGIVELLKGGIAEAGKEDWFAFATGLDASRGRWKFLAARADNFRLHATVKEVTNVEEFLKEVEKAA